MKQIAFIITFFILAFAGRSQSGQILFEKNCLTCHNKIGSAEGLTAPSLGGITNLVTVDWFIDFVSSSRLMGKNGDYRFWCAWEH